MFISCKFELFSPFSGSQKILQYCFHQTIPGGMGALKVSCLQNKLQFQILFSCMVCACMYVYMCVVYGYELWLLKIFFSYAYAYAVIVSPITIQLNRTIYQAT